ncbi:MAG: hypothetical protein SF052_02645 [Bacteroidia bacterium]|nr:hypothetical protein [Bacteroidia bacterium]
MKKFIYILLFFIPGYTLPGAVGQAAVNPTQVRPNQQLESQFQANNLSATQFPAFEKRAIQKLVDFGDYLEIIGNPAYEKSLREHAVELIYGLFVSKNVSIGQWGTVSALAHTRLAGKDKSGDIIITDISVSQPLKFQENRVAGELTFALKSVKNNIQQTYSSEITLRQTHKKFGNETIGVWEVFLGEIKEK